MKGYTWRLVVVLGVVLAAVIYVIPTFKPGVWPHNQINLGLDLQGGMHLALEVENEKAVKSTVERIRGELRSLLRGERIRHGMIEHSGETGLELRLLNSEDLDKFKNLIKENYSDIEVRSTSQKEDGFYVEIGIIDERVKELRKQAVEQALQTIRNRIDEFGVNEPDIRVQGERRILVQLPGIEDIGRAKELIGKTAQLEFKLIDEDHSLENALEGNVAPGSEILRGSSEAAGGEPRAYLVKRQAMLTGAHLEDARVQIGSQFNEPYVTIEFDRAGARIFERITGENVNKRLAVVLDNKVYSAPVIQEKIPGGTARITGKFSMQEAHDLAIVLRAGALPAPVHIIEERTVGPSLGADSIRMGLISMAVGGVLVLIFMVLYYQVGGLIANLALALNILLIAAGLAAFGATLTLPGIAGIILTIGIAVDANVIIFERIREEYRLGKTPGAAISAGFDRAAVAVLDANVTTLIAALVLYQFGTGPVKGFAVTLSLGVVASLFTALFACRLIFDYLYSLRRWKTLSI
ncbi:MAG: protein translocase subunit SecD [Desulfobacteraceae bacterium]|nr:protein translocase subunit SecD [Desulfobacteraceae bacterium]MCF8094163.1 protein translocase subunit SecD [Desulfobacteraceae bacterium]